MISHTKCFQALVAVEFGKKFNHQIMLASILELVEVGALSIKKGEKCFEKYSGYKIKFVDEEPPEPKPFKIPKQCVECKTKMCGDCKELLLNE